MQPGPGLGCSEAGLLIKPRLVQNLNSNMKALKANSVSFFFVYNLMLNAPKRIEKIIRENRD